MYENNYPNDYETNSQNQMPPRGMYGGYMPIEPNHVKQPKNPKGNQGSFWKKALAAALAGILFGGCAAGSFYVIDRVAGITSDRTPETEAAANMAELSELDTADTAAGEQIVTTVVTDVTSVVKEVMPAAVSITNSYIAVEQSFFGEKYEIPREGSGSGVIIGKNDTELLIATNNHVVENAKELTVQFIDGEHVKAQIKGTAPTIDIAVIAVSLADISESTLSSINIAEMGDSSGLNIGEPAIAIGNSLGYGQSVTTGVISALDREVVVEGEKIGTTLIQTDAAINPGNSGGALLNMNGQVIGINSNKIAGMANISIEGMGYAIPISAAKPIIEQLMNTETRTKLGEGERGYLGIRGANVTTEVAEVYAGMPVGVYIVSVAGGSGADKAGLVKGNVITKMEGISIAKIEELNEKLSYYAAGDTITLTVAIAGPEGYHEEEISVTLSGTEIMGADIRTEE